MDQLIIMQLQDRNVLSRIGVLMFVICCTTTTMTFALRPDGFDHFKQQNNSSSTAVVRPLRKDHNIRHQQLELLSKHEEERSEFVKGKSKKYI